MKKILLASCVAAISAGVNAELTPLSEYELHSVTGQAGVDIELDLGIKIGEIRYTDTAENGDGDGGSLVIKDVFLGGGEGRNTLFGVSNPGNTANINNFLFKIDVANSGDLHISGSPVSAGVAGGIGIVDFLLTTGEVFTQGVNPVDKMLLVDSMSVYGGATAFNMTVDSDTNDIMFQVAVGIDDLDIDMSSSFGIVIENASIYGNQYFERLAGNVLGPTQYGFEVFVEMSQDEENGGVLFDFTKGYGDLDPDSIYRNTNKFDVILPSITVGDGNIGSVLIDDLNLQGITVAMRGH
jgi:hypothetical protein